MRKYARRPQEVPLVKRVKSVPPARLSVLTTQIEADLAPSLRTILHGHFAHLMRCKLLPQEGMNKMLAFHKRHFLRSPANLRLPSEQIEPCHCGLNL